jgi:hypothetical protein
VIPATPKAYLPALIRRFLLDKPIAESFSLFIIASLVLDSLVVLAHNASNIAYNLVTVHQCVFDELVIGIGVFILRENSGVCICTQGTIILERAFGH